MHPIFSVSANDIARLSDEEARALVARLCRAELAAKGVSPDAVRWGGDQRAADGGVDVRVEVEPPMGISGSIRKDRTVFQVKAEKFPAGKIAGEMAPKGVLRAALIDLARTGGAYIIASSRDSLADTSLEKRRAAMRQCLADFGLAGKVEVDFYDGRKLADWAEQYPATVVWVKSRTGSALAGWKPYGPWAYQEDDVTAEYLADERVRVFTPESADGSTIAAAMAQLRAALGKPGAVRLVGHSGVGKTRLVQALFDPRLCPEQAALDPDAVIYGDVSNTLEPPPTTMVEGLITSGADCVLVIDNCSPDLHGKLTEMVTKAKSALRLITIEYDIKDDLPEATRCYRMEGASEETIKALLRRRFAVLSETDISTIAAFSDGNARIALALAGTAQGYGELARLRDRELFKRLFHQRNGESEDLLRCAEVASLVYSFDGEDRSPGAHISRLAELAEVSGTRFMGYMAELQRRGLLQQRGKWRAVLPQAIANRLAAQALETFSAEQLTRQLVEQGGAHLARSFSRRLGYLHESGRAQALVSNWLADGGLLGTLISLNELGCAIFCNVAPVNPTLALAALERLVASLDAGATANHDLRQLALVARSIAYEPEIFDRAIRVLIGLARVEPAENGKPAALEPLQSLFYCFLSGTEAPPEQRAEVVRGLFASGVAAENALGQTLLKAALKTDGFASAADFAFGARKRGYGHWPRTQAEVRAWFAPFIGIAVAIGHVHAPEGKVVREALGQAVRGLWVRFGLIDEIVTAAKALKPVDGWPDGWLGLRRILLWDKAKLKAEALGRLLTLEAALRPVDLKAQILARVIVRGGYADDLIVGGNDEASEITDAGTRVKASASAAEGLGRAAAVEADLLAELMPELLAANSNGKVWNFGFGVGRESDGATQVLEQARAVIAKAEAGKISLIFVRGVIWGWHAVAPDAVAAFLDQAVQDAVWGPWFPELQARIGLDGSGYIRLVRALEHGAAPAWQYKYLAQGRATDPLSVPEIADLVGRLAQRPDGMAVALDLLAMVIRCAAEKDAAYGVALGRAAIGFLADLDWSRVGSDHGRMDHDVDMILAFALDADGSEAEKLRILERLVVLERSPERSYSYEHGRPLAPFFARFPRQTLDAVYRADKDGSYWTAQRIVAGNDSDRREAGIYTVPAEVFLEWCAVSPADRHAFAAATCRLFEMDGAGEPQAISDMAVRLLAVAEDKAKIVRILLGRFQPTGWFGELSAILRRRQPLIAGLNPSGDERVKALIERAQRDFGEWIAREQEREAADDRARGERFE
jgi:hypothetical protein